MKWAINYHLPSFLAHLFFHKADEIQNNYHMKKECAIVSISAEGQGGGMTHHQNTNLLEGVSTHLMFRKGAFA